MSFICKLCKSVLIYDVPGMKNNFGIDNLLYTDGFVIFNDIKSDLHYIILYYTNQILI